MKKELRLIAGIILHPVKVLYHKFYRSADEYTIRCRVKLNWESKNYERMHRFGGADFPSCSAFTKSPLYDNLLQGAL